MWRGCSGGRELGGMSEFPADAIEHPIDTSYSLKVNSTKGWNDYESQDGFCGGGGSGDGDVLVVLRRVENTGRAFAGKSGTDCCADKPGRGPDGWGGER